MTHFQYRLNREDSCMNPSDSVNAHDVLRITSFLNNRGYRTYPGSLSGSEILQIDVVNHNDSKSGISEDDDN